MFSNLQKCYKNVNQNEYNPEVFNFNHIKCNKGNNLYNKLRYIKIDDLNTNLYNNNEKKSQTGKKGSKIFSKYENFKIQKDRYQKFNLNNSVCSINIDKKILEPLSMQLKRNNSFIISKGSMLNNSRNDLCTDLYNNNIEEDNNNNKNHLILSQNDIYNNPEYKHMNILDKFTLYPKQYIYNKFNGKKRTDITNKEIWDKIQPPTNQDYIDYIYKHKEVDLFNKRLIERKNKLIMSERNKIIMKERKVLKEGDDFFKRAKLKEALYNKNKIKYYKNQLDYQMKHFLENKLHNENLKYSQFLKNKDYNRLKSPIMKYLNQNDYFDVNPFNNRSINLGKSNLKYDTILNPKIQFKTNKYLFPEIANNLSNYALPKINY